ncbi:MAG: archaetidylserine decarboxylase [Deltaproteobacteria bacterium]|nr:archaetidylserine decarboxylase [Deltaproteobacteria bacterium]
MSLQKLADHDFWIQSRLLPRRLITRLMFFVTRISFPQFLVQAWIRFWIKNYNISLDDCVVPEKGFKNFNAFHLRELKPGARPIGEGDIILPCDGIVTDFGPIGFSARLKIKGNFYNFDELITNNSKACKLDETIRKKFEGGTFLSIYLPVYSYHWWHAPLEATIKQCFVHGGDYITVSEKAQEKCRQLFVKNHRLVEFFFDGEECKLISVAVAAFMVGTILSEYPRHKDGVTLLNHPVQKGEKLGGFAFGSSILLFLPKGVPLTPDLERGAFYKLGKSLGNFKSSTT